MTNDDITLRSAQDIFKMYNLFDLNTGVAQKIIQRAIDEATANLETSRQQAWREAESAKECASRADKRAIDEATAEYKEALRIAGECHQSTADQYAVKLEGLQKQLAAGGVAGALRGVAEPVAYMTDAPWGRCVSLDKPDFGLATWKAPMPRVTPLYTAPPAEPRSCTCHPDDAVHPCAQKYAASECQKPQDMLDLTPVGPGRTVDDYLHDRPHGERVLLMRDPKGSPLWWQSTLDIPTAQRLGFAYRYATLDSEEA